MARAQTFGAPTYLRPLACRPVGELVAKRDLLLNPACDRIADSVLPLAGGILRRGWYRSSAYGRPHQFAWTIRAAVLQKMMTTPTIEEVGHYRLRASQCHQYRAGFRLGATLVAKGARAGRSAPNGRRSLRPCLSGGDLSARWVVTVYESSAGGPGCQRSCPEPRAPGLR
jgi:hypothetical protein